MPDSAAPAKVCILCREDCSARPRTKDLQGRYTCKRCLEKGAPQRQAAARPAPPPVPPSPPPPAAPVDDDAPDAFWDSLPEQTAAATTPCPGCSAPLTAGTIVCLSCGHNLQTGRGARVKVAKAKRERSAPRVKLTMSPGLVSIVLLVIFGGGFIFAMGSQDASVIYYLAASVLLLVATISAVFCAFLDQDTPWGIAGVLGFIVPGVALVTLYYGLFRTERGMIRAMMAVGLIASILGVVALMTTGVFEEYRSTP